MKDTHDIPTLLSKGITEEGMERLLASDFVEGIGPAYAR